MVPPAARLEPARAGRAGTTARLVVVVRHDVVEVAEKSKEKTPFQVAAAGAHAPARSAPYLSTDLSNLRVTVLRAAARTEVPIICDTQLVVEFYSR